MKKSNIDLRIFVPFAIVAIAFIIFGAVKPDTFALVTSSIKNWMCEAFVGFTLIIAVVCSVVLVIIACSKYGKNTKLGGPDSTPQYKTSTWIFMVVCGNIGIAMMFFAVVEPITFFTNPPSFWGIEAGTDEAAAMAIAQPTFHWGGFTWTIDLFAGFTAVLLCMNYKIPFRPSSALYPVIKEKAFGPVGTVYDAVCVISMLGGMMVAFGLAVTQFCTGLDYVVGIPANMLTYTIVIVLACLIVSFSSMRGLSKGLAMFSNVNVGLYAFFIVFLLLVGPTFATMELFTDATGKLISEFVPMAFNGDFLKDDGGWNIDYTIFTWLWAFSVGPVTGIFMAKISRGRTLRQFLLVVVGFATLFMLVWFTVWGATAINAEVQGFGIMAQVQEWGNPVANFATINALPFSPGFKTVISLLVLICLAIGYITYVDAMSNTVAGLCVKKVDENLDAAPKVRLFIITVLGASTLVCLAVLDTVGMSSLQTLMVMLGVPMAIICIPIIKGIFNIMSGETEKYILSPKGQEGIKKKQEELGIDDLS